jgi:hypothetical protein
MTIKSFGDSMWSSGSRGRILMENMLSVGFTTSPHHQDHPAVLDRILDSGKLAPIFARLHWTSLFGAFCWRKFSNASCQSGCLSSLYRHRMGPASGGIHHKTCCLFCCCLKAVMANNGVVIEQMDSQQPNTHQPVPSRAAISFNKK